MCSSTGLYLPLKCDSARLFLPQTCCSRPLQPGSMVGGRLKPSTPARRGPSTDSNCCCTMLALASVWPSTARTTTVGYQIAERTEKGSHSMMGTHRCPGPTGQKCTRSTKPGGMWPISPCSRVWLNHQTQFKVASSTSSTLCQGAFVADAFGPRPRWPTCSPSTESSLCQGGVQGAVRARRVDVSCVS